MSNDGEVQNLYVLFRIFIVIITLFFVRLRLIYSIGSQMLDFNHQKAIWTKSMEKVKKGKTLRKLNLHCIGSLSNDNYQAKE